MSKLLNIDANPKTIKGQKKGFMTAVLYLAPYKASGVNVCPMAELAGCYLGCLNVAGRGGMSKGNAVFATESGLLLPDNAIQHARIRKTRWYAEDRAGFMAQLVKEIGAFIRKAERAGLTPCVRLNGTSDIQWEIGHETAEAESIFAHFPGVQFYDYSKIPKRLTRDLPANYHLSLSYSEASERYAGLCRSAYIDGASLVVVARNKAVKAEMIAAYDNAIDGDESDLRFTDPAGSLVILAAKGRAKKDESGFVVDSLAVDERHYKCPACGRHYDDGIPECDSDDCPNYQQKVELA